MMNPYLKRQNAYKQTAINTASKEQLVLMLYDGIIRFSEQGRSAIENKEIEKKQQSLTRAQNIIFELTNSLDFEHGGEIATNLSRLYSYAIRRLVDANMKNDTTGIDETQNIFRNLREAWAGAMAKVAKERAAGTAPVVEHTAAAPAVGDAPRSFAAAAAPGAEGYTPLSIQC